MTIDNSQCMERYLETVRMGLFMFLLLTSTTTHAQSLLSPLNQWNISTTGWIGGENTETHLLRTGDSIQFNGNAYHNIERSEDEQGLMWTPTGMSLREDSTSKVFMLVNDTETLIYDFGLELGDIFQLEDNCDVQVIEIDSIQLNNGEYRKRIKLERTEDPYNYPVLEWIEGIGSKFGLLDFLGVVCLVDINIQLTCFYQSGELLYPPNPETCFTSTTSTKDTDLAHSMVTVMPNPFGETFVISIEDDEQKFKLGIYSMDGNLVYQKVSARTGRVEISLKDYNSGIYIIRLYFQDGTSIFRKIVKE